MEQLSALLVADPVLAAAELADAMADEVRQLETLRYDDGGGAGAPSVAAAFELSYRQLDADTARLFWLLPANPGPDLSTEAAAELAAWSEARVRAALGQLEQAHLVEPAGRAGRWRMHDLLRLYARQLSGNGPEERKQATSRLLAWYVLRADAANARLRALVDTSPASFVDSDEALAWLDAERPNLIAAVTLAAADGYDQIAMRLPLLLSQYLLWRRRFDDWLTVTVTSRDSARGMNDRGHEAAALSNLGAGLAGVRRFGEAIRACQDAAAICRETGDRHREGNALTNLGMSLREVRRFEEAISAHEGALAIYRETGDPHGEGNALNNLGLVLGQVGRFEDAITAHEGAVAIYRETGDRHHEGTALTNLGLVLGQMRRYEDGIIAHQHAVATCRETSNRHGEGAALANLGVLLTEVRRYEDAINACQGAVAISRETGDRHGEGMALANLGNAYQGMRRPGRAVTCWQEAAAAMRDADDKADAAHLEQMAANTKTRQRRWWQR